MVNVRILGFLLILILSSCCADITCTSGGNGEFYFQGFRSKDIDTFTVTKFKSNTNFAQEVETKEFRLSNTFSVSGFDGENLLVVGFFLNGVYFFQSGFDYELKIPSTGHSFRLTDIIEENKEGTVCGFAKGECLTYIASVRVDGVPSGRIPVFKK